MDNAVVLSCCCKVFGCAEHIRMLIMNNHMTCPECKSKVFANTIRSLPTLGESINNFMKQREEILKITLPTTPEPVQTPTSVEEKEVAAEAPLRSTEATARSPTRSSTPSKSDDRHSQSDRKCIFSFIFLQVASRSSRSRDRSRDRSQHRSQHRSRDRSHSSRKYRSSHRSRDRSRSHHHSRSHRH